MYLVRLWQIIRSGADCGSLCLMNDRAKRRFAFTPKAMAPMYALAAAVLNEQIAPHFKSGTPGSRLRFIAATQPSAPDRRRNKPQGEERAHLSRVNLLCCGIVPMYSLHGRISTVIRISTVARHRALMQSRFNRATLFGAGTKIYELPWRHCCQRAGVRRVQ